MTKQKKQRHKARQRKDSSVPLKVKKRAVQATAVGYKKKTKKPRKKQKRKNYRRIGLEIIITFFVSSVLFSLISFFTFSVPKVEGYSMMATLVDGERVFVGKLGAIKRFKLVYYKDPESKVTTIRRVIGLPQDSLYYKDDQLFINNEVIVERFLVEQLAKQGNSTFTKDFTLNELLGDDQVPKGKYFVLGDNRSYAADSREFGYIDEKDIIGIVEARIFPLHRMTRF